MRTFDMGGLVSMPEGPTASCCCGEQVSAMAGICHDCAMVRCSMGWCNRTDSPAVGAE